MKQEIKDKFPLWCQDGDTKYNLILSDDIDSLMCYTFQNWYFNRQVKFFFDANAQGFTQKLYKATEVESVGNDNVIGLDIALEGDIKTWDNHIVKIKRADITNSNSANLNLALDVCQINYTDKACVSTFITMLSYYDIDISTWSKEQLAVLCAIDGLYYPFREGSNFVATGRKNLRLLEYEFLEDFIKENMDLILALKDELKLDAKIKVGADGKLTTAIDLDSLSEIFEDIFWYISLPNCEFTEKSTLEKKYVQNVNYSKDYLIEKYNIFNFALCYRNKGVISYLI